jgi:hypothetical protein
MHTDRRTNKYGVNKPYTDSNVAKRDMGVGRNYVKMWNALMSVLQMEA